MRLVLLLVLGLSAHSTAGGGGGGAYDPPGGMAMASNFSTNDSDCKKLDINDYKDVKKDLLLKTIQYTDRLDNSVESKLNLVEELAEDNRWEKVAEVRERMNPNTIRAHYRETREELLESSHKLFRMIRDQGYKGEFDWNAYIEGFRNIATMKLTRVINDLEDMLKCLGISRTDMDAVKPQYFRFLECGEKTLNLEQDMAEEWRSIAREFGIKEHVVFSERNIPMQCATAVLNQFYDFAFSWQQIIDIIEEAGFKKIAVKLKNAIQNYCVID